ncbi:MAG: hypothetical protein IT462_18015 [Planctomycetes bacterium]|nr:hypothetical protein [Planctomycetota bacterium]
MEPLIFLAVFVVIFGVAVAASVAHAKKVRENWAMFARAHNLSFTPGSFNRHTLTGVFQGQQVSVFTEVRGSGKSRTTYTIFAALTRVPPDLNVYQEGALSFLTKALGVQDIRTGDGELDARFIIQGGDPRGISNLLTHPRVRHCMLSVGASQAGLRIYAGRAIIEMRGVPSDMAVLQRCLGGAAQVAAALDEAMGGAPVQVLAPAAFRPPPAVVSGVQAGPLELFGAVATAMAQAPLSKQPQKIPASKLRGARVEARNNQPAINPLVMAGPEGGPAVPFPPLPGKPASATTATKQEPPGPEQFGAWGAEVPAPVLGKPEEQTPAQPTSKSEPPAAQPLEDVLKRLSSPGLTSDEREKLVAAITGKSCALTATVERVDWTSDLSLPSDMRSGRTAICKYTGATIAARFAESRNAEIDALSTGAALELRGTVAGWEDFYGRILVNAT